MSEEILKALTQLFAIITKQGGVSEVERQFVKRFFKQRLATDEIDAYIELYESHIKDKKRSKRKQEDNDEVGRTSMKDSVRTLAICRKVNKTLTQKQKVIVLVELLELVNSDRNFSDQRREILNTVSEVFNINRDEYQLIEALVLGSSNSISLNSNDILIISDAPTQFKLQHHIRSRALSGDIYILNVRSVDLYFVKYIGRDQVILNDMALESGVVHLCSVGCSIKPPKDSPIYFSDIVAKFNNTDEQNKISFHCRDLEFKFPNGNLGLRNINISEESGKLIGIMGASGAGKTTLLNVLAGIEKPSSGSVTVNDVDIHANKNQVQGIVGYITQDDILFEELTVSENLKYNAMLCFRDKTDQEIDEIVDSTLENLGLLPIKHLKVGNVLNKKISGGQRKRLNIALELIREPTVLFVDEPTSGLSSKDSENVIGLLKELSSKGKLVFVVIHQPSSDIFKMFDKMVIMDTGGYPVYYGHPIEAVTYFKKAADQVNSTSGQCVQCGSVNPEQIFDIIESRVVNEYGQLTTKRKVTPQVWNKLYKESHSFDLVLPKKDPPVNNLNVPGKIKQWTVYTLRDLKTKLRNRQYILINLLEAPILALLLSWIIRYRNSLDGNRYVFGYNENLPAFILMSIIVMLFIGLTVSAEEIIKDRKIRRREHLLNLSRSSYLFSKVGILFSFSALQTVLFVLIGNTVLEIEGMYGSYILILFSVACFANMLGLNISSTFNKAITIYIVIPLLLIPQMILSGALFDFDKLNVAISNKVKTPVLADFMTSRWAFEALAVTQYKDNEYERYFYDVESIKSKLDYRKSYLIPELKSQLRQLKSVNENEKVNILAVLKAETDKLEHEFPSVSKSNSFDFSSYNTLQVQELQKYYNLLAGHLNQQFIKQSAAKDDLLKRVESYYAKNGETLKQLKNRANNGAIQDLVTGSTNTTKYLVTKSQIVQKVDPVYFNSSPSHYFDFRDHFYSPEKFVFGVYIDTFWFNISIIWLMTIVLYITLYFRLFKRLVNLISNH